MELVFLWIIQGIRTATHHPDQIIHERGSGEQYLGGGKNGD